MYYSTKIQTINFKIYLHKSATHDDYIGDPIAANTVLGNLSVEMVERLLCTNNNNIKNRKRRKGKWTMIRQRLFISSVYNFM